MRTKPVIPLFLSPQNPVNNLHYEYGGPGTGNQSGRLVKQEDVNGIQQFAYDELGNTTVNIKTMIVPFDSIYTFATYTAYDTWNRIDSIVYPDGETVKYYYNEGGLLRSMEGVKDTMTFSYVQQVGYDKFESRTYIEYGNGSKNYYAYDAGNRHLSQLRAVTGDNHEMMVNDYSYDGVGNITGILSNTSPHANEIGGFIENSFSYDSIYRLIQSGGTSIVTGGDYEYSLDMAYYPSGKIKGKELSSALNSNPIASLTYTLDYDYQGSQPHAPSSVGSESLLYDGNGNLQQGINSSTGIKRCHAWDEENRMKLVNDGRALGYYLYDGGGERSLKITGQYTTLNINGEPAFEGYQSSSQTLYVNPYMVVNNREYTKHYYVENQRICSKLGGGFLMDTINLFGFVYGFGVASTQDYNDKKTNDEGMVSRDIDSSAHPGSFMMTAGLYDFLSVQPAREDAEEDLFFYHGDHLGSTAYITDASGIPSQHVAYIPFGEVLLEEKAQTWQSPYKFNCKELDEESGLYYYGARYYDPKTSVWLGVDPMSDKYPGLSSFVYCANNPILLTDPDGKDARVSIQQGSNGNPGTITISSTIYITGSRANEFNAKHYTEQAKKAFGPGTYTNENGDKFNLTFDIKYEYKKEISASDLNPGDNILELNGGEISGVPYQRTTKDGKTTESAGNRGTVSKNGSTGKSTKTVFHESLHFFGLKDRYKNDENGVSRPDKGYENDRMGSYDGDQIVPQHYNDWGSKYSKMGSGNYILKDKVD